MGVSLLSSFNLYYLNSYYQHPPRQTATFRDPHCRRGSYGDRYPTTSTHTVLDQVYGDITARACCTDVIARKDVYNKGGHTIVEAKFNLSYKPRPKKAASPKPNFKLLHNKKTRKQVITALRTNVLAQITSDDSLDNRAQKFISCAKDVIEEF